MTECVPWVKWRFDKWQHDPGLRMCGLAARGLWADLLAIMHGCEPYGHLSVQGRSPSPKQIASMVGMTSEREVIALMKELEENGVFSRSGDGQVFCRRMVRDNTARLNGKYYGAQGGNPDLLAKSAEGDNPADERGLTPNPTPPVGRTLNPDKDTERKREREKETPPISPPASRGGRKRLNCSRIPDDWQPDEKGKAFARAKNANFDEAAVQAFRDYHAAHGSLMADWPAAWRTWCGNAERFGRSTANQPEQKMHPALARMSSRL